MSLEIIDLTKSYGQQKAVDNISFSIGKNELVGFLGPNGAGKSTTMKMAIGYIKSTLGTVKVCDIDVAEKAKEVKKLIGYLPEHNPLYLDQYVHEYLRFCGKFYGFNRSALNHRVSNVIDLCGLGIEQNKKIKQLSKGFRQRVGLAQALLHDPPVLILDEPTTGLDPNQLVEIRNLIKEVGKSKTVIFSTHIMQEVESICDRAVVINKGKIVADEKIANLGNLNKQNIVTLEFSSPIDISLLKTVDGVNSIKETGQCKYEVLSNQSRIREILMATITQNSLPLIGIQLKETSLEDTFASLTQNTEK